MFGIINLHKPTGPTSRDCVNHIQRQIPKRKVGHAGTLDPIASGVLLVLVGPAVRLTDDIHALEKEYVGTFQLGVTSPSADNETTIEHLETAPILAIHQVVEAAQSFIGSIEQVPPVYSAVRIGGKRAHSLARKGREIEIPARKVSIHSIEIQSFDYPMMQIKVACGTGTYIRSIGRDIARSLGSDAIMTHLERTRIGPFKLSDAVKLESLQSEEQIGQAIMPPLLGVPHMRHVELSDQELTRFRQGQHLEMSQWIGWKGERLIATDQQRALHAILHYDAVHDVWKAEKYLRFSDGDC